MRYRELRDEELMYCYACGDANAFDEIVSRYGRRLCEFAFRMLRDAGRAEDVVQEAFVRVHLYAGRYKYGAAKFSTWIYKITRNLAISELRKMGRRREDATAEAVAGGEAPEQAVLRGEFNAALQAALAALPADQRTAFVLREIQGMPYDEIARVEGVRIGTVRSRLNRARNALARALGPYLDGDLK